MQMVLDYGARRMKLDRLLNDSMPTSTPCDVTAEPLKISNAKPKAKRSDYGKALIAAMNKLSEDPEALAAIEKRAF